MIGDGAAPEQPVVDTIVHVPGIGTPRERVQFYDPQTLEGLGPVSLPGLEPYGQAGMAIAWQAAARRLVNSVLVFGWSGTGKKLLPLWVAGQLCRAGLDCFLIRIQCCRLALSSSLDAVRTHLSRVDAVIEYGRYRPTLVSLEEIDDLQRSADSPVQIRLYEWALDLLSLESTPGGVVVFCVTNDPSRVARALQPKVGFSMFIDLPDVDTATKLLQLSGIPRAAEVARDLYSGADETQVAFSRRALIASAQYTSGVEGDLTSRESQEISSLLMAASAAIDAEEYRQYKDANSLLISRAHDFLESAQSTWTRLFRTGRAQQFP